MSSEINHFILLVDAICASIAGIVNFSYFFFHPNGKKWVRFFASIVLGYFGTIQALAFLFIINPSTHGVEYLRPWFPVLYAISVWDTQVDWSLKKNFIDERSLAYKLYKLVIPYLTFIQPAKPAQKKNNTKRKSHTKKKAGLDNGVNRTHQ